MLFLDMQIIETIFLREKIEMCFNEYSKEYTSKKHGHISTKGKTPIDTSFHFD